MVRRRRSSLWLLIGLTALAAVDESTVQAHAPARVTRHTPLALLLTRHEVYSSPGAVRLPRSAIAPRRPITGVRTALPVIGRATDAGGARWLHVLVPGRPNGTTGWIAMAGTAEAATEWRLTVSTTSFRLRVFRRGHLLRTFPAIVGKASTPTPHGHYFVEESVHMRPSSAGGPYALALSAHSNVLQHFEGGAGQIAIHGVSHLQGALGTASSHGCIRLSDRTVRWLSARIAPGVPVDITA